MLVCLRIRCKYHIVLYGDVSLGQRTVIRFNKCYFVYVSSSVMLSAYLHQRFTWVDHVILRRPGGDAVRQPRYQTLTRHAVSLNTPCLISSCTPPRSVTIWMPHWHCSSLTIASVPVKKILSYVNKIDRRQIMTAHEQEFGCTFLGIHRTSRHWLVWSRLRISRVSCQKGPTRHAYTWQIGPFWQDTHDT